MAIDQPQIVCALVLALLRDVPGKSTRSGELTPIAVHALQYCLYGPRPCQKSVPRLPKSITASGLPLSNPAQNDNSK